MRDATQPAYVLHVTDSLAPGGKERIVVDLANACHRSGRRVFVCITRHQMELAADLDRPIPVHVLGRKRRFDYRAIQRFAGLVRNGQVRLLHVHGRSSLSFVAFACQIGLLSRNLPILLHDHHGIEIDPSVPSWFRAWGRHFVTSYVGVTPRLAEWARRAGIPSERIFVVENALDLARLRPAGVVDVRRECNLPTQAPVGIVVCGIRQEKGIDFLLEALARQRRVFHVLIVGPDADARHAAECRALTVRLGLDDRVTFLGPRSDVPAFLAGCDFALMPSRSESGPLVLIEYMAAGLPVVSTRVGATAERIAASGGQMFIRPGDVVSFAAAVDELLALTPRERVARGAWGPPFVAGAFDIRDAVPVWEDIYARTVRRVSGRGGAAEDPALPQIPGAPTM